MLHPVSQVTASLQSVAMRILISNDDGYLAPGLAALVQACQGLGEIDVIAPEQNASGTSNALTLGRPLNIFQARGEGVQGFNVVNGTPSDCVHIALTGLLLSVGVAIVQFWPDYIWVGAVLAVFFSGQFLEGNVLTPKLVVDRVGVGVPLQAEHFDFAFPVPRPEVHQQIVLPGMVASHTEHWHVLPMVECQNRCRAVRVRHQALPRRQGVDQCLRHLTRCP